MSRQGRRCVCCVCGVEFRHLSWWTKYCESHKAEAKKAQAGTRPARVPNMKCEQCGSIFHSYDKKRKFCGYECHLKSGGAQRAGEAAAKMKMKYGAKKDANHGEIVDGLRKMGAHVLDLSSMGCGVPDIMVKCMHGWNFADIKNPKTSYGRRGLNPRQKKWADEWTGGPVYLISSLDEAADFVNGRLDGLKKFGGWQGDPGEPFTDEQLDALGCRRWSAA